MKKIAFIILLVFPLISISQIDQTLNNYEINFITNKMDMQNKTQDLKFKIENFLRKKLILL